MLPELAEAKDLSSSHTSIGYDETLTQMSEQAWRCARSRAAFPPDFGQVLAAKFRVATGRRSLASKLARHGEARRPGPPKC